MTFIAFANSAEWLARPLIADKVRGSNPSLGHRNFFRIFFIFVLIFTPRRSYFQELRLTRLPIYALNKNGHF